MNIGTQRRTVYIEPVEEPESSPVKEPSPAIAPPLRSTSGEATRTRSLRPHGRPVEPDPGWDRPPSSGIELGTTRSVSMKLDSTRSLKGVA
jgi:hypothetical protein